MKTGEIFTRALTNPKDEFKSMGQQFGDHVAHFNAVGKLVDTEGELVFPTYDMDWEIVWEPVDFMTAANSGKRIKSNACFEFHSISWYLQGQAHLTLDEVNGKWLIE